MKPDFDLRFINVLQGVATGKMPGQNVDQTTIILWGWRKRFDKFLHPDVVEIALAEELARYRRGEAGIWIPHEEDVVADAQDNMGFIYLNG